MIYTLTLNPALDRTLFINSIKADDSNRIEKEERFAGGKGIDVSRVLNELEVPNIALGFAGGFAGDELEGRLINEGIGCRFIRIREETRTNIILNDLTTHRQTVFSAKGPGIEPFELIRLVRLIESLENPETFIISGSIPEGVHSEIYRKIIDQVRSQGAYVALDTDGAALKAGIQAGPQLIKPNIHELGRLIGRELGSIPEIVDAARDLVGKGIETVLVSMGPQGILMVTAATVLHAIPPAVKVVNTIGAGDSSVAGFIAARTSGLEAAECLRYAVAAGTATTLQTGTALGKKEDIAELLNRISVKPV